MPRIYKKSPGTPISTEFVESKSAAEIEKELNSQFLKIYIGHGLMLLGSPDFENGPLNVIHDAAGYYGSVYFLRITQQKVVDVCQDDLTYINEVVRLINDEECI